MYLITQKTSVLNGCVVPPGSKSQSIRGLFLALLASGKSVLSNCLDSEDAIDAMRVCKDLGLTIVSSRDQLILASKGLPLSSQINRIYSGNSGITTRFVMPLLGLRQQSHQPIILNCGEQMRARPIQPLVDALIDLGLTIRYLEQDGMLPVAISGKLRGGQTHITGLTSQYLSALLISLPCATEDSEITVTDLHERPYVEMTLNWLKQQNIQYTHAQKDNQDVYRIKGNQRYNHFETTIAGDFSSASYLIASAALTQGTVELPGLTMQDPQGDKRLVNLLQEMGATIQVTSTGITIPGSNRLKGIRIDANDIPDLLPALAVIGTQAEGKTEITHVRQARIKETDRIHSMTEGLRRMGAKIEEYEDGMTVYQSSLQGAQVKGYGDHRTVMALSMAGMMALGKTLVDEGESINKTFPQFVNVMRSLGANMEVQHD